jgi:2-succinyl-5-enolpyruvyl-6-hydroxy-3-cyclohexene-1-carboxylate synthase
MNELVNHNILWSELLVTALETYGIKYACISPGSRNTPLVVAFQKSKKIKSFVHIDERSSVFFALGLVYQTK